MDLLSSAIGSINDFLWTYIIIVVLVGCGLWFTLMTGFIQLRALPEMVRLLAGDLGRRPSGRKAISSFQAFCVSTASRVGVGNIAGVAIAIVTGGPGAVFWMWVAAFFGMATKYAEGLLAVKYRTTDERGEIAGGPMYYIRHGMGEKYRPLATFFAAATVLVAFFGIGTFPQVNAIVDSVELSFGVPRIATDLVLTALIAAITIGGLRSIAHVSARIIPFMAVLYIVICAGIILMHLSEIPAAIALILDSAFTGTAAAGGFAGSTVMMAMKNGIARGVFSNESGLGSAPIAAAAAKTKEPAEQGLISMTGTFIDTIIICSMTGLVLVLTGAWHGDAAGAAMTGAAFTSLYGSIGGALLTVSLALFAFTTILGWNYYGERAVLYLAGMRAILPYRLVFIALIACGAFLKLEAIWVLADIVNGLMAIPNLIALIALSGIVVRETRTYLEKMKK